METLVKDKVPVLDHEKLDVYRIAIEFVILSDAIILDSAVQDAKAMQDFVVQGVRRGGDITQLVRTHPAETPWAAKGCVDLVSSTAESRIIEHIPRGRGYLSDQLQRAALSISLNIAEGAGEYAIDEKVRFYRMAKRSATECAGILDVCQKLQLLDEQKYIKGRELIIRIVSILVKMAQRKN